MIVLNHNNHTLPFQLGHTHSLPVSLARMPSRRQMPDNTYVALITCGRGSREQMEWQLAEVSDIEECPGKRFAKGCRGSETGNLLVNAADGVPVRECWRVTTSTRTFGVVSRPVPEMMNGMRGSRYVSCTVPDRARW